MEVEMNVELMIQRDVVSSREARVSYQRWMLVHSMMSGTVLVFSDKLHVVQFYK